MQKVVEVCSGAGFLGVGLEHCGFQVTLRCDHSQPMLDLASHLYPSPVACGDICTDSLLHPICQASEPAGVLASGVACQPYSKLGDKQHQRDSRSMTLPSVLRYAFLCRFGSVILECVADAQTCPWVQSVIRTFTEITGYKVTQGTLHLHTIWPTRRSRWWCILTHASFGIVQWQPMPFSTAMPLIVDLVDHFKTCTKEELEQLALDLYELGRFGAQGFEKNEIPWRGQMATSLHSCGSQLSACPCLCRLFPFSDDRLAQKGLHGLLVRLNEVIKCGYKEYQCYRHVHPAETCPFQWYVAEHGLGENHKLALCALGQLASPIQSTWIGSLLMQSLQTMQGISTVIEPYENLMSWFDKLLAGRDEVFGTQQNPNAMHFQSLVKSRIYATKTSPLTSQHVDIPVTSASTVSQDRQMPSTTEACDARDPLSVGTEATKAKEPNLPSTATDSGDHPEDPQDGSPTEVSDPTVNMPKWVAPPNGGVFGFENQHPPKRRRVGNIPVATDVHPGNHAVPFCDAAQTMPIRPEPTQMSDSAFLQPECHESAPTKEDSVNICPSATATPKVDPPTPFQAMPLPRLGCGGPSHGDMTEIIGGILQAPEVIGQTTPSARPDQVPLPNFAFDVGSLALTAEPSVFRPHDKSPPEQTLPLPRLYRNHPGRSQHPSIGVHRSCNLTTRPSLTELLALHDKNDHDHTPCQPDLPCQTGEPSPGHGMEVPDPEGPSIYETRALQAVEPDVANAKPSCSSVIEHDDPPTLFQAMPPPRLGCGGPPHDVPAERQAELMTIHAVDKSLTEHVALHDMNNPDRTPCQQDLHCQSEDLLPSHGMEVSDPDRTHTRVARILQAAMPDVANVKSCCSSVAEHDDPPTLFQAKPPPRLGCGGPSHDVPTDGEADSATDHAVAHGMPEYMNVFVKHEHSIHPIPCTVPVDCTAGTLTKAEAALKSMTMPIAPRSLVGTHLPLDSKLHPDQYVMIYQNFPKSNKCPFFS